MYSPDLDAGMVEHFASDPYFIEPMQTNRGLGLIDSSAGFRLVVGERLRGDSKAGGDRIGHDGEVGAPVDQSLHRMAVNLDISNHLVGVVTRQRDGEVWRVPWHEIARAIRCGPQDHAAVRDIQFYIKIR